MAIGILFALVTLFLKLQSKSFIKFGKDNDELKAIVAKNMAKDINFYHINSSFGVKGIGYKKSEDTKAPKGKYKSSGYGDLDKK